MIAINGLNNTSPSQQMTLTINQHEVTLQLRMLHNGITVADVTIDGERICSSWRVMPNTLIIPYSYKCEDFGNFVFYCLTDDYPVYSDFLNNCQLCYLSPEEAKSWQ